PPARLDPARAGMLCFLLSEVAFFSTLIMTYVFYLGKSQSGPTPQVLALPLVIGTTICLLTSSLTVHLGERALRAGNVPRFGLFGGAPILLGVAFLAGTAYEWRELIVVRGLTPATNLFGTTYYTLVGFHAAHVTIGVLALLAVLGLGLRQRIATGAEM